MTTKQDGWQFTFPTVAAASQYARDVLETSGHLLGGPLLEVDLAQATWLAAVRKNVDPNEVVELNRGGMFNAEMAGSVADELIDILSKIAHDRPGLCGAVDCFTVSPTAPWAQYFVTRGDAIFGPGKHEGYVVFQGDSKDGIAKLLRAGGGVPSSILVFAEGKPDAAWDEAAWRRFALSWEILIFDCYDGESSLIGLRDDNLAHAFVSPK